MSYPDEPEHTPFGQRLRDRTQPLALDDAEHGFAHAYLSEALSRPYLELQEVFDPEGDIPPVAPLLDPYLCPDWALPWLAQFVGLRLPVGMSADDARIVIAKASGFARGTPAAIKAAAGLYLTGTKSVQFRERNGSAYALEVVTFTGETPDPAATQAAILAQKPGGIILSYRVIDSWDYQLMTERGGTYQQQSSDYATYADLAVDRKVTP